MIGKFLKFYFPVFIICGLSLLIGTFLRTKYGFEFMISDINGMGWTISFLGTVYTLISAFVVAEVWRQFNSMGEMLADEAKSISSIWDYVNYLNDKEVSDKVRVTLKKYVEKLIETEIKEASQLIRTSHPSEELIALHRVIDSIKFDDKRDSTVFPSLVSGYENLSSIRAKRIESGLTRVPLFLKSLLLFLSLIIGVCFIFLGFYNIYLYLVCLFSVAFVVSGIYMIVTDLDNPYEGIWNLDTTMLENVLKYIKEEDHH